MIDPLTAIYFLTALLVMGTAGIEFILACYKLSDKRQKRRQLGR